MFTVTLPFPPPVNNLYRNVPGRGRVTTERYRTWKQAAGWDMRQAMMARNNPPPLEGEVQVFITLCKPDRRKRDLDGMAKAIIDQLVEHQVIADDSQVTWLRLAWSETGPAATVMVEPALPREERQAA